LKPLKAGGQDDMETSATHALQDPPEHPLCGGWVPDISTVEPPHVLPYYEHGPTEEYQVMSDTQQSK